MTTEELRSRILLNPNNYIPWLFAMEAKLIGIDALEIVTGVTPAPAEHAANKKGRLLQDQPQGLLANPPCYQNMTVTADTVCGNSFQTNMPAQILLHNPSPLDTSYFGLSTLSIFISDMQTANQKLVLSGLTLDDQFKTLMMLDKLPISFNSFRDIISMGFATELFDRILRKLENYGIQNKIDSIVDSELLKSPVTSMYTKAIESDIHCPHCKRSFRFCSHCGKTGHTEPNCYAKNNPSNHQSKAIGSTFKHQHSPNLVMTKEDEDAINDIYHRYPDLRL
ncbi:hypothetical protein PSHT_15769 [Puccinia striiformis]|uniref:CCHC-type domain-containing protein n=1 Tax=Puccinia striiformis TaxID=27350 RepID=A0A2S4UDL1_9BASI|nr:hypothetical protein PSHT_15769 [Puccinia striiformis]